MLAHRIPTILPDLIEEEALETTVIYSIAGLLDHQRALLTERPFRAPHHTASAVAVIGGGSDPRPGEISLAHNGVLFLDELPEFRRDVLEVLRQPMEEGAVNPCMCGYLTHPRKPCRCSTIQIERYRWKVSGPLLDRIDLHVEVPALSPQDLDGDAVAELSSVIRQRGNAVRAIQHARFADAAITTNAQMSHKQLRGHCALPKAAKDLLRSAMRELHLSARAHDKILKVARTIADLAAAETIQPEHVAEAIQYRAWIGSWGANLAANGQASGRGLRRNEPLQCRR